MVGKICCVLSVLILAPDYEYIWKLSWLSSQQHIKWPNSGWVPVKTPSGHHCEKSKTTWHLKSLNPQKSGLNSRCSDLNRLRFTVYSLLIIKFSCIYSCPRFSCKIKRLLTSQSSAWGSKSQSAACSAPAATSCYHKNLNPAVHIHSVPPQKLYKGAEIYSLITCFSVVHIEPHN